MTRIERKYRISKVNEYDVYRDIVKTLWFNRKIDREFLTNYRKRVKL